jgi:hypothetical protein
MIRESFLGLSLVASLYGAAHAAEKRTLESLATIKGECSKLIVMGTDTKCDSTITNQTWSDGRASFTFFGFGGKVVVTFSGLGRNQVKPDADTAVQPIDNIILTYPGSKPEGMHVVGTCRLTNPYAGKAPVECRADSSEGPFRGVFVSDGEPPIMTKH